jgi:hypothetical protein
MISGICGTLEYRGMSICIRCDEQDDSRGTSRQPPSGLHQRIARHQAQQTGTGGGAIPRAQRV